MAAQPAPAAETEAPQLVSQFPPPPFYYKLYRDGENGEEQPEFEPPKPPKPIIGTYTMFGTVYSVRISKSRSDIVESTYLQVPT